MIVIKAPAGTSLNVPHPDEVVTLVNGSLHIILLAVVPTKLTSWNWIIYIVTDPIPLFHGHDSKSTNMNALILILRASTSTSLVEMGPSRRSSAQTSPSLIPAALTAARNPPPKESTSLLRPSLLPAARAPKVKPDTLDPLWSAFQFYQSLGRNLIGLATFIWWAASGLTQWEARDQVLLLAHAMKSSTCILLLEADSKILRVFKGSKVCCFALHQRPESDFPSGLWSLNWHWCQTSNSGPMLGHLSTFWNQILFKHAQF